MRADEIDGTAVDVVVLGHVVVVSVGHREVVEIFDAREDLALHEARAVTEQRPRHISGAREDDLIKLERLLTHRSGSGGGGGGGSLCPRVIGLAPRPVAGNRILGSELRTTAAPRGWGGTDSHADRRATLGLAAAFDGLDARPETELAVLALNAPADLFVVSAEVVEGDVRRRLRE